MTNIYIKKARNLSQTISNSAIVKWLMVHKKVVAIIIILTFLSLFGYYIYGHPEIIDDVLSIGYINVFILLILYSGVVLTNVSVVHATIRLCRRDLSLKNSLFLTIYSSVVNFFGPLQSGPAVRAVYLKRKIGLHIRDYTIAMIFYYLSFGVINASLLFIPKSPWLSVLGIIVAFIMTAIGTAKLGFGPHKKYVFYILISTIIQIIFMVFIYSIELNAINPAAHYSLMQTISYTASANLAMFVSLTPGAIGIRETFLILSQSFHNIPLGSIVAAGIIDRAVYIVFLIIMFVLSSGLHLKSMFIRKK